MADVSIRVDKEELHGAVDAAGVRTVGAERQRALVRLVPGDVPLRMGVVWRGAEEGSREQQARTYPMLAHLPHPPSNQPCALPSRFPNRDRTHNWIRQSPNGRCTPAFCETSGREP